MKALSVLDKEEGNSISVQWLREKKAYLEVIAFTDQSVIYRGRGKIYKYKKMDTFMVTVAKPLQREIHCHLDFLVNVNLFEFVGGTAKW